MRSNASVKQMVPSEQAREGTPKKTSSARNRTKRDALNIIQGNILEVIQEEMSAMATCAAKTNIQEKWSLLILQDQKQTMITQYVCHYQPEIASAWTVLQNQETECHLIMLGVRIKMYVWGNIKEVEIAMDPSAASRATKWYP